MKAQHWDVNLHYNVFYVSWNKKTFLTKMNMINFIFLVLLLHVSMVLLKCNFSSSDSFPTLRPIVSSIDTFNYNLSRFVCDLLSPLVRNSDYSWKYTFSFVSQIKNANLSREFLVSYYATSFFPIFHWKKPLIPISIITHISTPPKKLKKIFLLHHRFILFLTVSFIIKLME